jgi:hypothetical protein
VLSTKIHMPANRPSPEQPRLSFQRWRDRFLADAKANGLLGNAEMLNDTALRLFWEQGTAPTIEAVLATAKDSDPAA